MTSSPKDFAAGAVLTAAQMDSLPQGDIAHATPLTSSVGPTSGTTELDIITAPAVTLLATNRRLRITFTCRSYNASVTNDTFAVRIKEGSTILEEILVVAFGTGAGACSGANNFEAIVSSPTAAAHTYKATVQRTGGTGTLTIGATADGKITLEVEDIGEV